MKSLVFVNHFRNGDLAVSRGFVRALMILAKEKYPEIECYYSHKNDPWALSDMLDLNFDPDLVHQFPESMGTVWNRDTLIVNTWYCADNNRWFNTHDVTFDCLYHLFNDVAKRHFNIDLGERFTTQELFPWYDFEKVYGVNHIRKELSSRNLLDKRLILVANGQALSGHAVNFDLANPTLLATLSQPKNTVILYTDECEIKSIGGGAPMVHTLSLMPPKVNGMKSDLLQHAFLSQYCDVIIGRSSGVYTYAFHQDNLFKRDKTFIQFSNLRFPTWLGREFQSKITYQAKIVHNTTTDPTEAQRVIESVLQ